MSRPRIVHVYKDVYPAVEGGIERTIYHLARLTKDRFEPWVIVARPAGGESIDRIDGDMEVTSVATFGRALSTPIAPGFVGALKRSRADLFHFHFPHPTGEVAYLLSGLKTPAVATYHSDVIRQRAALALYRPLMHRFLARMRVIMPTSRRYLETSETLRSHVERCRVVPLGLPLEDYNATDAIRAKAEEYRRQFGEFIFFIGCLRYYKGLRFLLEAMPKVKSDVRLVIAGEGDEGRALRQQADELRLGDRVRFLGRVDQDEAVALFHAATIFCLPAHQRSEAFGLCQIEALACGLPVVSTDLPTGVPEINRDGETGLIVPPADASALAEALNRLLSDPDLRRRMGEAGRRRALANYTAGRMADAVARVYEGVLSIS